MPKEIALITGCGSGIGKELARQLHARTLDFGSKQYIVYATDYREDALQDLAQEGIQIARMDVTSLENVREVVAGILKEHGHIDLLVCNAGIATGGFLPELDYDEVERVFDVNVHGVFRTIQAVAPHMMARRKGKIAAMCSVMAYFAHPFQSAYIGSKGAIDRMLESLSMEVEPFGVTVTTVLPGLVKSDIEENAATDFDRYDTPESRYRDVIEGFRAGAKATNRKGMPARQAAAEIAVALSKPVPPRFLRTGKGVAMVLLHGILQNLFCAISAIINIINCGFGPLWKKNGARKRRIVAGLEEEVPLTQTLEQDRENIQEEVPENGVALKSGKED